MCQGLQISGAPPPLHYPLCWLNNRQRREIQGLKEEIFVDILVLEITFKRIFLTRITQGQGGKIWAVN